MKIKQYLKPLYPLVSLCLFILFWWILALIVDIEMIIPPPKSVIAGLFRLFGSGDYWLAVCNTTLRAIISFIFSFVLAIILAIISYFRPIFERLTSPLVIITRSTPTMSIILIAIIWFRSNISPIFITSLILFPLLYASFLGGLRAIPEGYKSLCEIYEVPYRTRIKKLYIPYMLPSVFVSSKSTISLGVKVMIASEVLAQTAKSMGNSMQLSRIYLDTATLIAWTFTAIVVSYLLELLIHLAKKGVITWQK